MLQSRQPLRSAARNFFRVLKSVSKNRTETLAGRLEKYRVTFLTQPTPRGMVFIHRQTRFTLKNLHKPAAANKTPLSLQNRFVVPVIQTRPEVRTVKMSVHVIEAKLRDANQVIPKAQFPSRGNDLFRATLTPPARRIVRSLVFSKPNDRPTFQFPRLTILCANYRPAIRRNHRRAVIIQTQPAPLARIHPFAARLTHGAFRCTAYNPHHRAQFSLSRRVPIMPKRAIEYMPAPARQTADRSRN